MTANHARAYPATQVDIDAMATLRYHVMAKKRALPEAEVHASYARWLAACLELGYLGVLRVAGAKYRIGCALRAQGEDLDRLFGGAP